MEEIVAAGAQRISLGGSLAGSAYAHAVGVATQARDGDFSSTGGWSKVYKLFEG
jgi:hypothetical protein